MMGMKAEALQQLRETLPPVFARTQVDKLLPGILTGKTLANMQSMGIGPVSFKIGSKTCFQRDLFIDWLASR